MFVLFFVKLLFTGKNEHSSSTYDVIVFSSKTTSKYIVLNGCLFIILHLIILFRSRLILKINLLEGETTNTDFLAITKRKTSYRSTYIIGIFPFPVRNTGQEEYTHTYMYNIYSQQA